MTDASSTAPATGRRARGGADARRAARTSTAIKQAGFIRREIKTYEPFSEEQLELIERNAETVLQETGIDIYEDEEVVAMWKAAGADAKVSSNDPRRFRLRTTMEIFWDFLGTARELDPKLARLQRPTPAAAELRYRGILEMTRKDASSPELPNYDKVNVAGQPWRDLTGFYTRFGDVRELVAKVDDRYVIMNAGDEIAFRFPAPASPPSGWKRDFIWECDGWTRDGDLNTRFGATVLPLPAHGVKEERLPTRLEDDPVFRRFPADWRDYHTRFVTSDVFARGLRAFKR